MDRIKRRRAADEQPVALQAAETDIGHHFGYVHLAEQGAVGMVAADAVAGARPEVAVLVDAKAVEDADGAGGEYGATGADVAARLGAIEDLTTRARRDFAAFTSNDRRSGLQPCTRTFRFFDSERPARKVGNSMKIAQIFALAALALGLQGCVAAGLAVAEAGAGIGIGAGIDHTMNGIVYKTFTASTNELRFAALDALDRMGMTVTSDVASEAGWQLTATATDRIIEIELQKLTVRATRMRIVANEGIVFFKDTSTATEIILQTAQALQDDLDAKSATGGNRKRTRS
jgi:hypothetical protein